MCVAQTEDVWQQTLAMKAAEQRRMVMKKLQQMMKKWQRYKAIVCEAREEEQGICDTRVLT